MMKRLLVLLLYWSPLALCDVPNQISQGFLSLPTSQQPSHLFSSGANIVDAHDLLAVSAVYYWAGKDKKFVDVVPGILYGISNDFSIFLNIPITPKNIIQPESSRGIEDIYIQGEYAYYHKNTYQSSLVATVVGALYLPTGSTKKNPATGTGSPAFLLGTTLSYTAIDWYWFLSPFAFLTTTHHGTKQGNQFFYQAGVGRNIISKQDSFIVAFLVGLFGIYAQHDIIKNNKDPNSGGNSCYIGPSLWISTKRFTSQMGIMYVVAQHLHGSQKKDRYIVGIDMRWKFNG